MLSIDQFRHISTWKTGVETHTQKRGSGEYSVKNKNKHSRESDVLLTNLRVIYGVFCSFFRVGHEQVFYRDSLPQWKLEKTESRFFFSVKSYDRKNWEAFSKRADKKFKRLIDPGILIHFEETDIAITFLGVKIFLHAAIRLSLTLQKAKNTTSARLKRLDNRNRRCAEQRKAIKGKALRLLPTNSSEKECKTRISHLEQNLSTKDIQKLWLCQHSQRSNSRTENLPFNRDAKKISGSFLLSYNTIQQCPI